MIGKLLTVAVAILAATWPASAQTTAFSAVSSQIGSGDTISVTDAKGREFTGKLTAASAGSITLDIGGASREFPEAATHKVVRRDSARNGTLIGFAVGAVPGVVIGNLFTTYCTNEASSCPWAPVYGGVLTGLLGALAGYEIDRHINTVLFKSASRSPTVRVAPVIDRHRQTMTLSLAFERGSRWT